MLSNRFSSALRKYSVKKFFSENYFLKGLEEDLKCIQATNFYM